MPLHQQRFEATRRAFFENLPDIPLAKNLVIPSYLTQNTYKCRVIYSKEIHVVEWLPYQPRRIGSLQMVVCDNLNYTYKFEDRNRLESLFAMRNSCDDVLIVRKGLITDTSYANIAFWDGSRWLTPDQPLLAGTMRQWLLHCKVIRPAKIQPFSVKTFQKARVFNAMIGWSELYEIPTKKIFPTSELA